MCDCSRYITRDGGDGSWAFSHTHCTLEGTHVGDFKPRRSVYSITRCRHPPRLGTPYRVWELGSVAEKSDLFFLLREPTFWRRVVSRISIEKSCVDDRKRVFVHSVQFQTFQSINDRTCLTKITFSTGWRIDTTHKVLLQNRVFSISILTIFMFVFVKIDVSHTSQWSVFGYFYFARLPLNDSVFVSMCSARRHHFHAKDVRTMDIRRGKLRHVRNAIVFFFCKNEHWNYRTFSLFRPLIYVPVCTIRQNNKLTNGN